ncbi:MAG: tetratricopeptide repeat protein [Bacteroidetes bacterium]|nr:tetratricopeptide repeat protein [Bacteroidota bacterium]
MDHGHIQRLIAANREQVRLKTATALQNLAMLHASFHDVEDADTRLGLLLSDSWAAMVFQTDYTRSIQLSQDAIRRYGADGSPVQVAGHEAIIGRCYTLQMRYAHGREYLLRAEQRCLRAEATEEMRALLSDILHDLAMNHQQSGGSAEGTLLYLERALEALAPTQWHTRKGVCLMGCGNAYFGQGKVEPALAHYQQAEALLADETGITNRAAVLSNIGLCYTNMGEYEIAETYLRSALDMRLRLGSYPDIANSYYNLFAHYERQGHTSAPMRTCWPAVTMPLSAIRAACSS